MKLNSLIGFKLFGSLQAAAIRFYNSEKTVKKAVDGLELHRLYGNDPKTVLVKISKRIAVLQWEREHSSDHSMELRAEQKDGHFLTSECSQAFRKISKAEHAERLTLKEKLTGKTQEDLIVDCENQLKAAKTEILRLRGILGMFGNKLRVSESTNYPQF